MSALSLLGQAKQREDVFPFGIFALRKQLRMLKRYRRCFARCLLMEREALCARCCARRWRGGQEPRGRIGRVPEP
jgi:hypothetical protein